MTQQINWIERLAKWLMFFASWQLGTRSATDPEAQAVRYNAERVMMLRAEVSALTMLLAQKDVFTRDEFIAQLNKEASLLDSDMAKRFPGWTSTDIGMNVDIAKAKDLMKDWRP
jgi:hypothetical protein